MSDYAYVASLRTLEHIGRVATKELAGAFEKQSFWRRQNASDGEAGVVDAILASDQIAAHHRPIDPGQHVIVQRIHFAKCGAHLSRLRYDATRKGGEGYESLLQIDALFAEREEEIAARVGINNRLHAQLRLMHLHYGSRNHTILAGRCDKVADHADVRIQGLGRGGSSSAQAHRFLRCGLDGCLSCCLRRCWGRSRRGSSRSCSPARGCCSATGLRL